MVVVFQVISDCIFCYVNIGKLKSEQWIYFINKSFNYYWVQNKYAFQFWIDKHTYFTHPAPEEMTISFDPALQLYN